MSADPLALLLPQSHHTDPSPPPVKSLTGILRLLLDFVYPPTCLHCRVLLQHGERHLCARCWSAIPSATGDHRLYGETRSRLVESGSVSGLAAVYVFEHDGPFQALAHALKYSGFLSVGTMLGERLGDEIMRSGLTADLILPMPLHKAKQRERGFNQAEVIARAVSRRTGIPVDRRLLRRVRNTGSQTKLHREERTENVAGAFRIEPEGWPVLRKKSCILIDDVITTGATIISAAAELRSAGAASVTAAAPALAELLVFRGSL